MDDIILIGPKHSGKTSVGRGLASLCFCNFIDLDNLISSKTGKKPRQLFSEDPEIFKKAEAEAMADLAGSGGEKSGYARPAGVGRCVIAVGGGIIDNPSAVEILKSSGAKTVCLNVSAESAWERINAKGELPPFLKTDNPKETHRALHERRMAEYKQIANTVINTEGKTLYEICQQIKSSLTV